MQSLLQYAVHTYIIASSGDSCGDFYLYLNTTVPYYPLNSFSLQYLSFLEKKVRYGKELWLSNQVPPSATV